MPIWGDFGPKKGSKNDPFFDPILGVSLGSGVPRPRDPRSGGDPKVVSPENRGGQLLGTWSETDRPKSGGGKMVVVKMMVVKMTTPKMGYPFLDPSFLEVGSGPVQIRYRQIR